MPRAAINLARAAGSQDPRTKPSRWVGRMSLVGDRYITARAPELSSRDARRARLARFSDTASNAEPRTSDAADLPVVGGTGRRILNLRLHQPGLAALRLKHQSAYGSDADEIDGFALDVDVKPRRQGLSIEQLANGSQPGVGGACPRTPAHIRRLRSRASHLVSVRPSSRGQLRRTPSRESCPPAHRLASPHPRSNTRSRAPASLPSHIRVRSS